MSLAHLRLAIAVGGLLAGLRVDAIEVGTVPGTLPATGAFGDAFAGSIATGNERLITLGSAQSTADVFDLNTFVNIPGQDLNGGAPGTSAEAAFNDPLPPGLSLDFSAALEDGGSDLRLSFELTNGTGAPIPSLSFLSFLDADIDSTLNGIFNEVVTVLGTPASGQNFQVGGSTLTAVRDGVLNGANALPPGSNTSPPGTENVAMALSFVLADIAVGEVIDIDILLSEDGSFIGGFALQQSDNDPNSAAAVTFSGLVSRAQSEAPAPGTAWLLAPFALLLAGRYRGLGARQARSASAAC